MNKPIHRGLTAHDIDNLLIYVLEEYLAPERITEGEEDRINTAYEDFCNENLDLSETLDFSETLQ